MVGGDRGVVLRAAILAVLGLCASVRGDVFWRRPVDLPAEWERAYRAPFASQGHEGDLTVYGVEGSLRGIGAALRDRHGDRLIWMPGEVMGWAVVVERGRLFRYLAQPRPDGGFWVTLLESNVRDAPPPGTRPAKHRLRAIPAPAGGAPAFYHHDGGNRATVEISEVTASPDGALESLSGRLRSDGWSPSPVNTGGFRMFVKGNHVAFLGAYRGPDGITRVLRLHKPLGVK